MVQALAATMPARHPRAKPTDKELWLSITPKREALHGNTLVPVREQIMELSVAQ